MGILTSVGFCLLLAVGLGTAAQSCDKGSDCGRQECCLKNTSTGSGECKRMGDVADYCYVKQPYAWSRPEEMVTSFDRCPCQTGYLCGPLGNGQSDSQYGFIGICTYG